MRACLYVFVSAYMLAELKSVIGQSNIKFLFHPVLVYKGVYKACI